MEKNDLQKIFPKGSELINESPLRKLNKRFRVLFFLFHYFVRRIEIDKDVELIFSSSHAVAKGVRKSNRNQLHISYFQARNFNYIWSDYELYFGKLRYVIHPVVYFLRKIDIRQSRNPDYIISNSVFVKDWVKAKYGRDSEVIYPPVDLSSFPLEIHKQDYYVAVGRLVHVKRFDLAIKAFNGSNRKLYIIGDGDQYANLKKMAFDNIVFLGFLESSEVSKYIQNAKGFIQTGVEGFGIAPIEAQACGTPVIAYGAGGVLETVINKKTGVFFDTQTVESLENAIERFEKIQFDANKIRKNALRFSLERFENEIVAFVKDKWDMHKKMTASKE